MDLMWLVLGGALVFFMHSGFSLLEVGSVSVRNTQNILFKNIISPTVAGILFWFCGYSFAYVRYLTCFTCFTRLAPLPHFLTQRARAGQRLRRRDVQRV